MTGNNRRLVVVLAATLAILGVSIAWSVSGSGGMWSHMNGRSGWMMGYLPKGATAPVRSFDDAKHNAQAFADRLGLKVDEVLQFERNYYAKLVDNKGNGATEVLVDPPSGAVSVEYGPAMMWNTKYGFHTSRQGNGMMGGSVKGNGSMMGGSVKGNGSMMGGSAKGNGSMMGGSSGGGPMMGGTSGSGGYGPMMGGSYSGMSRMMGVQTQTNPSRVTMDQARALVRRYLVTNQPGTTVETGGDSFPGYFTFETLHSDRIDGMVAVQASTGAVWPHWWHGAFVAEA